MKNYTTLFLLVSLFSIPDYLFCEKNANQLQRDVTRVYDMQQNSISNFKLFSTNYGIHSNEVSKSNTAGCYWPRNTQNSYVFGGGVWFAATKKGRKLVEISYNPNNGKSWFIPGHYKDGDTINKDKYLYRLYYSTDFDTKTGKSIELNNNSIWPYWKKDNLNNFPLNSSSKEFVYNVNDRNLTNYQNGPAIVSDEDFHSFYKDTDMMEFDGGPAFRKPLGYPIKLQFEEHNYSWKNEDFKDAMIRVYEIENFSDDTLDDCYFAPVMDIDIIIRFENGKVLGNYDDKIRYFSEDSCMRMGVAWSGFDSTRLGKGFGYFAFNVIESPTLDANGFIEPNIPIYDKKRQIGINRFGIWGVEKDIYEDSARYEYLSLKKIDKMGDSKDTRIFYSVGPFKMMPKSKARFALGYAFALPANGSETTGEYEDITGMPFGAAPCGNLPSKNGSVYSKIKKLTDLYYNEIVLSVESQNQIHELQISPNPASEYIEIKQPSEGLKPSEGYSIQIFNLFGEKVEQTSLPAQTSQTGMSDLLKIDISNLAPGVYFIRVGDKFEKFVKM